MGWYLSQEELEQSESVYNLKNFNDMYGELVPWYHKVLTCVLGFLRQFTLLASIITLYFIVGSYLEVDDLISSLSGENLSALQKLCDISILCPVIWIISTIYSALRGRGKGNDEHKMLRVYDNLVNQKRDLLVFVPFRRLSVWASITYLICFGLSYIINFGAIPSNQFSYYASGVTKWATGLFFYILFMYIWYFFAFAAKGDNNLFTWLAKSYWTDITSFFAYFFKWRNFTVSIFGRIFAIIIRIALIALFVVGSVIMLS